MVRRMLDLYQQLVATDGATPVETLVGRGG
jgi:hypothetical protein